MIFQLGFKLNIPDKDVQATFDLDTGLTGFVEKLGDSYQEYLFQAAPVEFKKAFLDKLLDQAVEKPYLNSKISRKSKQADALSNFWKEQNNSDS